jgi:Family of unknown function (DUF6356)
MGSTKAVFERWFVDHPRSVGETYWQHQRAAMGFSVHLFRAGAACLVHAIVPVWFMTTASRTIQKLHGRLVCNR